MSGQEMRYIKLRSEKKLLHNTAGWRFNKKEKTTYQGMTIYQTAAANENTNHNLIHVRKQEK